MKYWIQHFYEDRFACVLGDKPFIAEPPLTPEEAEADGRRFEEEFIGRITGSTTGTRRLARSRNPLGTRYDWFKPVRKEQRLERMLQDAWIGDAVLSLYARRKILLEDDRIESEKFIRMTSNRFLSAFGEASEVEAELGRVYQQEGLEAAFGWIEARLLPQFQRQEAKRAKRDTPRDVIR